MNPYDVLGVKQDATPEEITKAYRKLSKTHHPDRNPGDEEAVKKYREVQEAYELITEGPKQTQQAFTHDPFDLFGQFFNFGQQQKRGNDISCEKTISFEESFTGCDVEISIRRGETCPSCKGTRAEKNGTEPCTPCNGQGSVTYRQGNMTVKTHCSQCSGIGKKIIKPCHECNGEGQVKDTNKINIKLPEGVRNGDRVRLSGQGNRGPDGCGDAYLIIHVTPHQLFERVDDDLTYYMPITYTQAVFGGEVEVPTLSGMKKSQIKSASKTGDEIRIHGSGFKNPQTHRTGDCVVVLDVDTTPPLDLESLELLKKLQDIESPSKVMLEFKKKLPT